MVLSLGMRRRNSSGTCDGNGHDTRAPVSDWSRTTPSTKTQALGATNLAAFSVRFRTALRREFSITGHLPSSFPFEFCIFIADCDAQLFFQTPLDSGRNPNTLRRDMQFDVAHVSRRGCSHNPRTAKTHVLNLNLNLALRHPTPNAAWLLRLVARFLALICKSLCHLLSLVLLPLRQSKECRLVIRLEYAWDLSGCINQRYAGKGVGHNHANEYLSPAATPRRTKTVRRCLEHIGHFGLFLGHINQDGRLVMASCLFVELLAMKKCSEPKALSEIGSLLSGSLISISPGKASIVHEVDPRHMVRKRGQKSFYRTGDFTS